MPAGAAPAGTGASGTGSGRRKDCWGRFVHKVSLVQ